MGLISQPYDEDLEDFILGEVNGETIRGTVVDLEVELEKHLDLVQDYIEGNNDKADIVSDIGEAIYGEGFNYTLEFLAFIGIYAEGLEIE